MNKRTFLLVLAAGLPVLCRAGLAEPDNVLYGTIVIGTNPVTAANTNIFVEARLASNGPPIASYQMGSLPGAGNYYSLRINLENAAPSSATATQTSNTVFVVVRNSNAIDFVQTYVMADRGRFERLDFGGLPTTTIPAAWELFYFGSLSLGPDSIAPNGLSLLANYIAGSNPNSTANLFELSANRAGPGQKLISFPTIIAQGVGYTNLARWYDLQYQADLGGPWLAVPGYTKLLGSGLPVTYSDTNTNETGWYRARAYLLPQ